MPLFLQPAGVGGHPGDPDPAQSNQQRGGCLKPASRRRLPRGKVICFTQIDGPTSTEPDLRTTERTSTWFRCRIRAVRSEVTTRLQSHLKTRVVGTPWQRPARAWGHPAIGGCGPDAPGAPRGSREAVVASAPGRAPAARIIPSMRGRSPEFPGQCPGCPACPACPGDDVEATASLRPQNNWRYSGQRFILRETWFLRFVEIIIRVDG